MMSNRKWKLVRSVFIVLCMACAPIEPSAFAGTPTPQSPPAKSAANTASPHKSGKKKWIVILAIAAGVVVTAIVASQKKDSSNTPTITVGPPTVG